MTVEDQSYVDPPVWSAVDLRTGERTELLRREAPGHDPSSYVSERRDLPAPDGTLVPVTLVRHRDTPLDGTAPALVYGYAAYEEVYPDQEWDPAIPSLLDRGVVYAHAHVRGGGEGGRRWWLEGRLEHKQNTFTDYVAVADGLAEAGSSTVTGSRPAGSARAGCCRERCSASVRTGGGPWSPRSRSSTWCPRCSTPRSR